MIRVIPPVWLLATKLEAFAAAAATTASAAETLRMSSCLSMPAKNSVRVRRRTGRSTDLRRCGAHTHRSAAELQLRARGRARRLGCGGPCPSRHAAEMESICETHGRTSAGRKRRSRLTDGVRRSFQERPAALTEPGSGHLSVFATSVSKAVKLLPNGLIFVYAAP